MADRLLPGDGSGTGRLGPVGPVVSRGVQPSVAQRGLSAENNSLSRADSPSHLLNINRALPMNGSRIAAPLPELRDQARGRWRAILPLLGVPAGHLDGRQHPCPVCKGTDRWRFDDLDGNGSSFCNNCRARDGAMLAMEITGLSFVDMAARVRELLPNAPTTSGKPPRDEDRCRANMRVVWSMGVPVAGTMAESYLRSRGVWTDTLPQIEALRFVPQLRATKHAAGALPALIAKVTDINGNGVNVHRTFLEDGRRAYRAMMSGPVPDGAAIRLGHPGDCLGIAEGIETALRASLRFGVACWSSISAGGMEKWMPPADVTCVEIFGDADRSFTGQASAYILARKLTRLREPIACNVHLPAVLGTDWADDDVMAVAA